MGSQAWVALLALLFALLPERLAWRPVDGCCGEACACTGPEQPSCCEAEEGPVIVALCGCGEPHAPAQFERPPHRSAPPPASTQLVRPSGWGRTAERTESVPPSHKTAPEPPPPRRAG